MDGIVTDKNSLVQLANSIRGKNGESTEYHISEFFDKINHLTHYSKLSAYLNKTLVVIEDLDSNLTEIPTSAFYNFGNLISINLPSGLTSIGYYTFAYCTSLTTLELPEGITSIGDYAFENCTSLVLTSLPPGLTSIGNGAFHGCTSLSSITIGGPGNPVTDNMLGTSIFFLCPNLTSITVYTETGDPLLTDHFSASNVQNITYTKS